MAGVDPSTIWAPSGGIVSVATATPEIEMSKILTINSRLSSNRKMARVIKGVKRPWRRSSGRPTTLRVANQVN